MATRAAARTPWTTVSLQPLTGVLDVRSRPADIPAGGFRWKQNFSVTPEAKLCRRDGFSKLSFASVFANDDLHHQGMTRQPITFLFESTASDATRRLFAGTQSSIFVAHETTGLWDTIATGSGAPGSYWRAATLQDVVLFCNGTDQILQHTLGTATTSTVPDLTTLKYTAAHVVIEYAGVLMLMNFTETGVGRHMSRIAWSDLNAPTSWNLLAPNTIAGQQDLDYGDEILNAVLMQGSVYIFTRRAIWKCTVAAPNSSSQDFSFTKVYTEPKNQTGCLAFPRTLTSFGTEVRYLSRDGIYRYDPYIAAPEREDALHRADGVIYRKLDTAFTQADCNAPCAEFLPTPREFWVSWPSGSNTENNWTLVYQLDNKTADVVDHGFTALVNYRRTATETQCNEQQDFIGASGSDRCLKNMGGVFFRELAFIPTGNLTDDLDIAATTYQHQGYYSILRGLVPTGLYDREKILKNVLIDDDLSEEATPGKYQVRIGNSYNLVDTNESTAAANLPVVNLNERCSAQWRTLDNVAESVYKGTIVCLDPATVGSMTAQGLKPSLGRNFPCYEQNRFLWWELTIMNLDGSPRIGSDVCLQRVDFDLLAVPKV